MFSGKKRKAQVEWKDVNLGETDESIRQVDGRDVFLYLGVTEDTNPLYSQSGYAEQTPYGQVIVPPGLLLGWVYSRVSERLPGPGSRVIGQRITFPQTAHDGAKIRLQMEVMGKDDESRLLTLAIAGEDEEGRRVMEGELDVIGPPVMNDLFRDTYKNF
ncbi:MaoC/PaaZ C-terminal domain-containing protein [Desmospora activa]|uniref:Acyl dehydratase n=1 Tax=Desmospora activa DSM 45169 TaxID=1121389 RepID=A0A2T4Z867_9BACL|nr:MaoC/PaaZ C-terminal domain-containing protein [Desmospora activa]PTM58091.1 acyl dehydratase [Desmospora activa DSM 45169]